MLFRHFVAPIRIAWRYRRTRGANRALAAVDRMTKKSSLDTDCPEFVPNEPLTVIRSHSSKAYAISPNEPYLLLPKSAANHADMSLLRGTFARIVIPSPLKEPLTYSVPLEFV